ncbi:APC family permease [Nocardioides sp. SYSU D00038]|uniref:APC family permease n=1 Tax=Nocardioides sp. SYSU D00038 TaxID=2812554 RepID=UPI0019673452|nr:amino acid permease [Nocardioides sp. SYSU D00038]
MSTTRGLSVPQGVALMVGAVLGTGVLALPALAASVAGPASILAWGLLVALSVPLATTFGALGARYPDGGGVSTYARHAFGPRAATVVGWCFFVAVPIGAPAAAGFGAAYVADAVGGGRAVELGTVAAIMAVVAGMNSAGIRVSAGVQLGIAGALVVLLGVATLAALPHVDAGHLTPFAPHGWAAVGSAAALLVWAFAGWEVVCSLSGEFADPRRAIPRATALAVGGIGVLYLGLAFATVGALGDDAGPAPLSDLLVLGFGEAARPVTALVALLLSVGAMNAYFAGCSRLGAALARDGSLPAWLAHGSAAGEVPRRSLGVTVAGGAATLLAMAVTGADLTSTLLVVTGVFTLVYVVGTAAAVRLLPRGTAVHACAVVSLAATLGLLAVTGLPVLGSLAIGAAALVWCAVTDRRPARAAEPVVACPAGSTR